MAAVEKGGAGAVLAEAFVIPSNLQDQAELAEAMRAGRSGARRKAALLGTSKQGQPSASLKSTVKRQVDKDVGNIPSQRQIQAILR